MKTLTVTKDENGSYLKQEGKRFSPLFKTDIELYHWINKKGLKRIGVKKYKE